MSCTENILKRLRESRLAESAGYFVIDSTDAETEGDSEKYHCATEADAKAKVAELVDSGVDPDRIKISPINPKNESMNEADDEFKSSYEEFLEKCTSNPTWKKANAICEKYGYELSKESCVDVYSSGRKSPSVNFKVDRSKKYNPEIYFYAGKFGSDDPTMEIQTTAYGSLTLEEHAEFLEAVTNAHKMVEELSKIDFMTLHEEPADY